MSRNKTITTSVADGERYLARCIRAECAGEAETLTDKTVLGDMLEACRHIPAGSVDLLIADPPYNLTKSFHGTTFRRRSEDEYAEYTSRWLSAVVPLLKPTASVYVCCDWQSSLVIGQILGDFLTVRNRITWQREKGRGARANWKNGMEDIWFATVGDEYTFNLEAVKLRRRVIAPYRENGMARDWYEDDGVKYRDTCPSNFWDDITVPFWSMPENTAHPTQKPEKLIARLILASSNEGDMVLDPFLGSGTTSVTAKKLGRHYIGIEANEQYCVWAEERLERAEEDRRIQGYEDGIFRERNYGG